MPRSRDCKPYRIAFDVAASGLALASAKGILLHANGAFCQMLGYRSEVDLVGKHLREIVHDEEVTAAEAALKDLLDGQRTRYEADGRYRHRDGSV